MKIPQKTREQIKTKMSAIFAEELFNIFSGDASNEEKIEQTTAIVRMSLAMVNGVDFLMDLEEKEGEEDDAEIFQSIRELLDEQDEGD